MLAEVNADVVAGRLTISILLLGWTVSTLTSGVNSWLARAIAATSRLCALCLQPPTASTTATRSTQSNPQNSRGLRDLPWRVTSSAAEPASSGSTLPGRLKFIPAPHQTPRDGAYR